MIAFKHSYFTVMYLLSIDWWSTKAARSNVVTRNYMQTNMPGKYIDGRQSKTRIFKFAIVQETKKTNLFCNATLHCA